MRTVASLSTLRASPRCSGERSDGSGRRILRSSTRRSSGTAAMSLCTLAFTSAHHALALLLKSARERMDIVAAYEQVGTYRGAAASASDATMRHGVEHHRGARHQHHEGHRHSRPLPHRSVDVIEPDPPDDGVSDTEGWSDDECGEDDDHLHHADEAEPYRTGTAGKLGRWARGVTAGGAVVATVLDRRTRLAQSRPHGPLWSAAMARSRQCRGSTGTRFTVFQAGLGSAADPKYTVVPQR